MLKKRNLLIALVVMLAIVGFVVVSRFRRTEKPVVAVITFVSYPILDRSIEGIKDSLRKQGYGDENIQLRVTNANGQAALLPSIVTEVLSDHPDIVVPVSTPVAQAVLKAAPPDQKIVFSTVTNPRDLWTSSQPHNVTGVSDAVNYAANLQLIKDILPTLKTVGVIYNPGEANSRYGVEQITTLTARAGILLKVVSVASSNEVPEAARSIAPAVDVIYVGSDSTVVSALPSVLAAAVSRRIPVIASDSGSVDEGALAAVSVDYSALGRKAGDIIADLLRSGKMPGSIPNVTFFGDSLVVNTRAAKAMNVIVPAAVMKRATRIVN